MNFLIGCAVVVAIVVVLAWIFRPASRRSHYAPDERGRMVRVAPDAADPTPRGLAGEIADAARELRHERTLTPNQRTARRAVRQLRDESAYLKKRPFSDKYDLPTGTDAAST